MMDGTRDPNKTPQGVRNSGDDCSTAFPPDFSEGANKGIPHTSSFPTFPTQNLNGNMWIRRNASLENDNQRLFNSLDLDNSSPVYLERMSRLPSSCLRRGLPNSQSFASREQLVSCLVSRKNRKSVLKRDFSFPSLRSELTHRGVESPTYKLTCTPTDSSRALDKTSEEIGYPINVIRTPVELFTSSFSRPFVTNQSGDRCPLCTQTDHCPGLTAIGSAQGSHEPVGRRGHQAGHCGTSNVMYEQHDVDKCTATSKPSGNSNHMTSKSEHENGLHQDFCVDCGQVRHWPVNENSAGSDQGLISQLVPTVKPRIQPRVPSGAEGESSAQDIDIVAGQSENPIQEHPLGRSSVVSTTSKTRSNHARFEDMTDGGMADHSADAVASREPESTSSRSSTLRHPRASCQQMEHQHVHQVYQQIAPQFDHVKHKAWPRVKRFLKDLEPGSLVADVGCGNGRYCSVNPAVLKFGSDICQPFLEQARGQGHEVVVADNIALPYRDAIFDAVISIGVIHHFASVERRVKALAELSRVLSPGGKLMIYVWAFEQIHRKFEGQDVLIPWVKPETTGPTQRCTVSCTESHRNSLGSIGVSASEDDSSSKTLRRRRRLGRHFSEGSSTDRRSRSMDDATVAVGSGKFSTKARSRDHSPHNKFGVFDKRRKGSDARTLSGDTNVSGEEDSVFENSTASFPRQEGRENVQSSEEPILFAKWPSQLVSECRKLGKLLRSLSSKSDSQSTDGNCGNECDMHKAAELVEEVEDSIKDKREEGIACDATDQSRVETANNDTCDDASSIRSLFNRYTGHDPLSVQRDIDSHMDVNMNGNTRSRVCREHIRPGHREVVTDISTSVSFVMEGCSCDDQDNNNISQVATSYHSIQRVSGSPGYTMAAGHWRGKEQQNMYPCVSASSTTDPKSIPERSEDDRGETSTTLTYLQLPTPSVISSSADESDGTSSGTAGGSPFPSDLPECGSATSLALSYDSKAPASASDSLVSTDRSSANSDRTVTSTGVHAGPVPDQVNNVHSFTSQVRSSSDPGLEEISSPALEATAAPHMSDKFTNLVSENPNGNGVIMPQLVPTARMSESDLAVQFYYFRSDLLATFKSRSNTSTEVNFGASDLADSTDFLDTDSVFSVEHKNCEQQRNFSHQDSRDQILSPEIPKKLESIPLKRMSLDIRDGEDLIDNESNDDEDMSLTVDDTFQDIGNPFDSDYTKDRASISLGKSKAGFPPPRSTLKTLLLKIATRLHLRPTAAAYKTIDNKRDTKYPARRRRSFETDSSDNETSISNISSPSSYHPLYLPGPKDSTASDKYPHTCDSILSNVDSDSVRTPEDFQDDNDKISECERLSYRLGTPDDRQTYSDRDFIDDITQPQTSSCRFTNDSYKIQADKLGQFMERKTAFFQSLSQKLPSFLSKSKTHQDNRGCLRYSPMSFSSPEGEQENLTISLLEKGQLNMMENKPLGLSSSKRPNSLDFTKKRTRGRGRGPFVQDSRVYDHGKLSLSDAMTLLGDGMSEDSIMTQLDQSAKIVFAEMKRMNFAIRKFPLSSLDGDSKDGISPEALGAKDDNTTTAPIKDPCSRLPSYKMRNDKRKSAARRRFSDSLTSKAVRSKRGRGLVQLQKEISGNHRALKDENVQFPEQLLSDELIASVRSLEVNCGDIKLNSEGQHQPPRPTQDQPASLIQGPTYLSNISNNALLAEQEGDVDGFDLPEKGSLSTQTDNNLPETLMAGNVDENNETSLNDTELPAPNSPPWKSGELRQDIIAQLDKIIQQAESAAHQSKLRHVANAEPLSHDATPSATSSQSLLQNSPSSPAHHVKSMVDNQSNSDNSLSRYYHVFKKSELDELVTTHVPSLKIVDTFYDHANWCIIAEKK